jgi:hypothetical protein
MEIGEKLLLISAGNEMPWASTAVGGVTSIDARTATMIKGMIDLRIICPLFWVDPLK